MKFLKNVKGLTKSIAKGIRKGAGIVEDVVNTVDKSTGGALRQTAASLTGGLSENALEAFNKNKKYLSKALDVAEGKKTIKQGLEGTKYGEKYDKYEKQYKDVRQGLKDKDVVNRIKNTKVGNKLVERSTELGRNVLNKGEGFGRKALGI